jgi:hypothetical protein
VKTGHLRTALAAVVLGAGLLGLGAAGAGEAAGAPALSTVALPDDVAHIPADVTRLGPVPGSQHVTFDVVLASPDPGGLAAEVAAVSTPSSPEYRHYLTAAQFAAAYGPSAAVVQQVSAALRRLGLTVGTPLAGSVLVPVSGTASVVSAALHTPLEAVRLPQGQTSFVNTVAPQIPAALSGIVTGTVGLGGLALERPLLAHGSPTARPAPSGASTSKGSRGSGSRNIGSTGSINSEKDGANGSGGVGGGGGSGGLSTHDLAPLTAGPQSCSAATQTAAGHGSYTSTQLASDFGLDQLFAEGRTGIGQTIGIVEFEQFEESDIASFDACYGLDNPLRTEVVDGPVGGSPEGSSESALDIELASVNAPSASIVVYEAPNESSDASSLDVLNRIASEDAAQVVTTSWGICEALNAAGDAQAEYGIFARMAAQGQTMIAASGDDGSEDCWPNDGSTGLAIDDPGAQPYVLSTGGTTLVDGDVSTQSVWNDCQAPSLPNCDNPNGDNGAAGGGYSLLWARPSWQPVASGSETDPCGQANGCRSVPDLSGPASPSHGVVAYFAPFGGWTVYGGTSVVAPSVAGLFADTNQGCTAPLGMAGPALYAADNSSDFTDVSLGNNDFTDSNGGLFAAAAGYNAATGLGTPIDQNLAIALQGGDGCPSVDALSAGQGPLVGGAAFTIYGGGLGDATSVSFGPAGNGQIVSQSTTSLSVVPPPAKVPECVDVIVTNPRGVSPVTVGDRYGFGDATNCAGLGYRFVASDGGIFDFGADQFKGSAGNLALSAPIVGMAATSDGKGYWLVASDGGVFSYGDAQFYGSMGNKTLNKPIVGMAATPDGKGYWLVASDGGIFTFGDAQFHGSAGNIVLNKPIVGMAATPDGKGYWLVASDGGIFSFGDAPFEGSTGNIALNKPIVGMAATVSGDGYWLVASDGGIFSFGDARFHGSTGNIALNQPIVGMASTTDSGGYWLVAADGGIFSFGDAHFYGSTGAIHLNRPIVGMSTSV